jgi:hypothetical protein
MASEDAWRDFRSAGSDGQVLGRLRPFARPGSDLSLGMDASLR